MFTLPWLILYTFFGIALLMHILSWTPVPRMLTKKFLIFIHDDERKGLNGKAAGYWMHLYPYGDTNPKATVKHEMVHIYQNWRYTWLVMIALCRFDRFRFRFEAQAFAVSVNTGRSLDQAARFLANYYNLNVTVEEARRKIKSFM